MLVFAHGDQEVAAVREFGRAVARQNTLSVKVGPTGAELTVPRAVVEVLVRAAALLGAGRAVDVVSPEQEVSAQEAAEILGMSRPFVMNLVRKKVLPHKMVGTHHRIPMDAVLAYKKAQEPRGRQALENLFRETDELGH